jgi:nucleoside phosphorylase
MIYDRSEVDEASNCRSILHFIDRLRAQKEPEAVKQAVLHDLCWRVIKVDPYSRANILANAWYQLLSNDLKAEHPTLWDSIRDLDRLPPQKREKKDVAIVAVIGKELQAVLRALGRLPDASADQKSQKSSYWFSNIDRTNGPPLSAVATVVGEARNVPAALTVARLTNDFDLRLVMLIGIAAGVRGKVKLGDVVFAKQVHDYEGLRLELTRWPFWFWRRVVRRPRPKSWLVNQRILIPITQFNQTRMYNLWQGLMQNVSQEESPRAWQNAPLNFLDGTIAAGEKLIADGSLFRMYKGVDEDIRAGAMEDSGFVQAAEAADVPWCIFRGVSDFGDFTKNKEWHLGAALAAASAGITFLKDLW